MIKERGMIARFALNLALLLVTLPLWLTSAATWRLEATRARLRTALDQRDSSLPRQ